MTDAPDKKAIADRLQEAAARIKSKSLRRIERMPNNPFPRGSEWGDRLDEMWRDQRDRKEPRP